MRSQPIVEVSCENCPASIAIELTTTARGYDERDVGDDIKKEGWVTAGGHDYCPDCAVAMGLVDGDQHEEDEHNYNMVVAGGLSHA